LMQLWLHTALPKNARPARAFLFLLHSQLRPPSNHLP